MQQPHQPGVQVVIPDQNSANGGGHQQQQRLLRPLSVEEALQYSPMTSAPVFGLDSILRPDIGQPSIVGPESTHDRQAAGKIIDELDNETRNHGETSDSLDTTRQYMQHLLDGNSLTQFKFKLPSHPRGAQPAKPTPGQNAESIGRDRLGPFAKMVLDSTDVAYRYPSPTTPSPQKQDVKSKTKSLPTPSSSSKNISKSNKEAYIQNQSTSSAQLTPTAGKPVVLIPTVSMSSQPDEYVHIPDRVSTKRRKLSSEEDEITASRLRDQKAEADMALMKLQELLQEIFEAEDEIQPDTSGAEIPTSKLFRMPNAIEDLGPVLTSEIHVSLQKAMQKVTNYNRLGDIPNEYRTRVQKICEAPIISAQSMEFKLEDVSDEEADPWLKKLEDMRNALLAICTLLHTMPGDVSMENLCPEDLIQAIPSVLNHVFDDCIIPAVECRPHGKDSAVFNFVAANKSAVAGLTHQTKRILSLLASFLAHVDVAEGTITATEFLATKLIFVENAYNDKESALGFQKYEAVRRGAMDVLAKIFAKYPNQREFILDEILVSLEKLPSTRQSARQFKLIDGKNIQLLSALVMQLVQTTALQKSSARAMKGKRRRTSKKHGKNDDKDSDSSSDESELGDGPGGQEPRQQLSRQAEPLYDNAVRSAQYITKFIVQRAMTSTKTGDQPYRNILDLFTEDLINVLGSTDWPAAELLLRVLASQMVGIAEHDKSPANAKNMALELLGWMGSAISELTSTAQHLLPNLDENDSDMTDFLRQLYEEHTDRALHLQDLVVINGPYRIVLEYLLERDAGNWQLSSARGYLLASWAKTVCNVYKEDETVAGEDDTVDDLIDSLNNMLSDSRWLETNSEYDRITTSNARFAYLLTVLSMGFCKAFDTIIKVLLNSISSDQAKVRSRSLKSVIQMLERDPNLLDRDDSVMALIMRCATDASPMVRDSALSLIAKCIGLRPKLEEEGCRTILACSSDPTIGVRKRCIGLLKDIYVQTSRKELKLAITESLLQRTTDHENSLATQARQVLEEIWFSPFHAGIDTIQDSPQTKVSLRGLVDLIVGSVQHSDSVVGTLEVFLKGILTDDSKAMTANFKVCKSIVATMFERVVDNTDSSKSGLQALLQSITVFAKANAKLFTPDQLEILHPYIGNLVTGDDLLIFRSVVVIYRCVLPYLSTAHNTLLKDVQNDLFKSVSKLARTELNEVMACLWTINGVLQNTERLVKLTNSVLAGISKVKNTNFADPANADALGRVRSYIRIAGCVGKHCDLEKYQNYFKQAFPASEVTSVASLMADFIAPFALPQHPHTLRTMALESLGSISQTWPAQFSREKARVAFAAVFEENDPDLQNIVLRSFLEFFSMHEGKTEKLVQPTDTTADQENSTRLGGSLKASDNDGAAALIAQHFLRDMLSAALSKQDSYALTAIELIASINRQGLIHPKECAGVLVALETSPNPTVSKIAFETHKMLHQQHESMFDREYMRAVQEAFVYQRDVIGDPSGAYSRPYSAKLAPLFEIIKISNSKYQKKFLSNLCSKVDFELRKLDASGDPPGHLLLARFVCQNLAFFEYAQIAELLPTIGAMERIVGATGTAVAHAIETELSPPSVPSGPIEGGNTAPAAEQVNGAPPVPVTAIPNPKKLRELATAAGVLLMLWETRSYLRRLYGIASHIRHKETKGNAKELNKAASKVHGVTGDRFWEAISKLMSCLDSPENMVSTCRAFTTLLSIDDELKVSADDDRDDYDDMAAIDMDDMNVVLAPTANGSTRGKRKSSVSGSGAPKAKKPRGRPSNTKKRASTASEDDDFAD